MQNGLTETAIGSPMKAPVDELAEKGLRVCSGATLLLMLLLGTGRLELVREA